MHTALNLRNINVRIFRTLRNLRIHRNPHIRHILRNHRSLRNLRIRRSLWKCKFINLSIIKTRIVAGSNLVPPKAWRLCRTPTTPCRQRGSGTSSGRRTAGALPSTGLDCVSNITPSRTKETIVRTTGFILNLSLNLYENVKEKILSLSLRRSKCGMQNHRGILPFISAIRIKP